MGQSGAGQLPSQSPPLVAPCDQGTGENLMGTQFLNTRFAEVDPYFSYVILLCSHETSGAYNSKDDSNDDRPVEVQSGSGISLSSSQFKFGTRSLSTNGTDGVIHAPIAMARNGINGNRGRFTGEATIEGWVYLNAYRNCIVFGTIERTVVSGRSYQVGVDGSGYPYVLIYNQFTGYSAQITATDTIALNTWVSLCSTRDGSNEIRLFVNGVLQPTTLNDGTEFVGDGDNFGLNGTLNTATFSKVVNGYQDEIRFTQKCRYTASYTPATAAFPRV
jgi:hypothetical protein